MELTTISRSPASILGLGSNQSIDINYIQTAFEAGVNYFFFYNLSCENYISGLKPLLQQEREQVLVATGSEQRDRKALRQYLDLVRQRLDIEVIDLFLLEYVSPADDWTNIQEIVEELRHWQEQELIRYLGVTVHNRALAGKLVADRKIDVLMHRYNMAHRKAEKDVFPAAKNADIPVIAFTGTRWGSLLRGHPHWQGKIPTAADCYRYALSNDAVRIALTAPQSLAQLNENIQVLKNPQLDPAAKARWQSYGDLIYGDGQDSFETQFL